MTTENNNSASEARGWKEIDARITGYLAAGGLFNPEMALHDRVRDLLMDIRDAIEASGLLAS